MYRTLSFTLSDHKIDLSDVLLSEEDKILLPRFKIALKTVQRWTGTISKWTSYKLFKNGTDLLLDLLVGLYVLNYFLKREELPLEGKTA